MPTLSQTDGVHVLHLGDGENRFTHTWLDEAESALDEVLRAPAPLVTVASGKSYSTGLDLAALVQAKLTPRAAVDSMTTGHRFPGPEAQAAGIVEAIAEADDLLAAALSRVAHLTGKDPGTLAAIKSTMFGEAFRLLTEATAG